MRWRERLHKLRFERAVRAMRATPPLAGGSEALTLLSMVHHRDVLAYLLAAKSFARFLRPAQIVVVADPTLDASDRALLREHLPQLRLREAAEFHRPGAVQGGTWERLYAIAEETRESYVIQLDADTVSLAPLAAVEAAWRAGVGFTLGTEDDMQIADAAVVAAWARARLAEGDHVQAHAEAQLDRLGAGCTRYVRGCSGFAGFARGSVDAGRVREISDRMAALLGARWSAWGTEQFTSNLLVANSDGARVLPHPAYCAPHRRRAETVFLHFIGYVRHASGLYAELARTMARELADAASPARRLAA
jgi:hypothetical protein